MRNQGLILSTLLATTALAAIAPTGAAAQAESRQAADFDLPAQPLAASLEAVARQTGANIVYAPQTVEGRTAPALKGNYDARAAVKRLTAGNNLTLRVNADNTLLLTLKESPGETLAAAGNASGRGVASSYGEGEGNGQRDDTLGGSSELKIAEILVEGSRSLNVDIRRTRDDTQPYVVFDGEELLQSEALTVEDFLRQRLPMNVQGGRVPVKEGVLPSGTSGLGGLDLRGLGTDETLILVNGRRLPGFTFAGYFEQPTLDGIAPSSIERIEVLPATAGGMYGGGATGGVINIILKNDYSGFEIGGTYGATTDGKAEQRKIYTSGGLSIAGFDVVFSGAYTDGDSLTSNDRNFSKRALQLSQDNAPELIVTNAYFGSTPNIAGIFGAQLTLDPAYGGVALNSDHTFIPVGYAGPSSDNASALLANAGQYNATGTKRSLWAAPKQVSGMLSIRRQLSSDVEAYFDVSANTSRNQFLRPVTLQVGLAGTNVNNPFAQTIFVYATVPDLENRSMSESSSKRFAAGMNAKLSERWNLGVEYNSGISSSKYESITTIPAAGASTTLAESLLRDVTVFPITNLETLLFDAINRGVKNKNRLSDWSLRLTGSPLQLPGGRISLNALLQQRHERSSDLLTFSQTANNPTGQYMRLPSASERVSTAYLELTAPLIAKGNAVALIEALTATASIRYDSYELIYSRDRFTSSSEADLYRQGVNYSQAAFDSTDLSIGLKYQPISDLTLRASFSTGFKPPRHYQISQGVTSIVYPPSSLRDPLRDGEQLTGDPDSIPPGAVNVISGGNPDLKPENSKSSSYGLIIEPSFFSGFRASVDYVKTVKTNEIWDPGAQFVLDNEQLYADRVVRASSTSSTPGVVTSIDRTALNLLKSKVDAIDFRADYDVAFSEDTGLHLYGIFTHALNAKQQLIAEEKAINKVGFNDGPLKFSGNFGFDLKHRNIALGWNTQFYGNYMVCSSVTDTLFGVYPLCIGNFRLK